MPEATRTLDSYKDLCTQFYDLDKPQPPQAAFDFYWRQYEAAGGPVLEAMCGSGRFLIPFAERGADIDGVDASPQMLAACRRRADEAGLHPGLYLQFLQDLETPRMYNFVFCPAGSFQLIPRGDQLAALQALARHMHPGATLALEMGFPGESRADGAGDPPPERRVTRPDGAEIVLTSDEHGGMRYDLVRNGSVIATEYETFALHPTPRDEFERLLAAAGFTVIRALWPYSDDVARPNAPFAVYLCTKGSHA